VLYAAFTLAWWAFAFAMMVDVMEDIFVVVVVGRVELVFGLLIGVIPIGVGSMWWLLLFRACSDVVQVEGSC